MKLDPTPPGAGPGIARLLDALGAEQAATRYVGGAVRDTLLGIAVSDVDLATRLPPDEVVAPARGGADQGGADRDRPRHDHRGRGGQAGRGHHAAPRRLTDGRRATVAFTDDWREDAARRDFTINALSADPRQRRVFDYFGGLADLEARRVRFIGDPLQRIAEDHLRILRFFRFHARFGARRARSPPRSTPAPRAPTT